MEEVSMSRDKNLYFLPIIAKAFDSLDDGQSLNQAIQRIIELGELPEYEKGYKQFLAFVNYGMEKNHNVKIDEIKLRLTEKLATGEIDGPDEVGESLLEGILKEDKLRSEFNRIKSNLHSDVPDDYSLEIQLFKGDKFIEEFSYNSKSPLYEFRRIYTGYYTIKLSNGRILWQSELELNDLVWKEAFPDQEYELAADTTGELGETSLDKTLSEKSLRVRVYPGLESGRIVLNVLDKEQLS